MMIGIIVMTLRHYLAIQRESDVSSCTAGTLVLVYLYASPSVNMFTHPLMPLFVNVVGIHYAHRAEASFDELVFAGVGEPLLRWPVVEEVGTSVGPAVPNKVYTRGRCTRDFFHSFFSMTVSPIFVFFRKYPFLSTSIYG